MFGGRGEEIKEIKEFKKFKDVLYSIASNNLEQPLTTPRIIPFCQDVVILIFDKFCSENIFLYLCMLIVYVVSTYARCRIVRAH